MQFGLLMCRLCILGVLVPSTASARSPAAAQTAPSPVLSKPVAWFEVDHICLLDALLQLGQEAGVPLGIEYVDRKALEKPITMKWTETTVGEIVEELLAEHQGYSWRVRDGVLTVSHESVASGEGNLLDDVLPEFSTPRCSVVEASHVLEMSLYRKIHPDVEGFAGDYSPGHLQNLIGPLKLRNVRVWKVLNRLVSGNKPAAWIVQVPPGHLDELPSYGLWTIVEYESPPRRYAAVLRSTIWGTGPKRADSKQE